LEELMFEKQFFSATLMTLVLSSAGCATTGPYIDSRLEAPIEVRQSPMNEITSLRAYENEGEIVIYGKVEPHYRFCRAAPLVEVSVEREGDADPERLCLPIVDRGSYRRGWYSASFRARLPDAAQTRRLEISFHDDECYSTQGVDPRVLRAREGTR
jgi:hypothetical protein